MTNKRGMVMEMNDSEGIIITSDRGKEKETIAEHLALCRESGVCQYHMWLNEEWDNMLLDEGKSI